MGSDLPVSSRLLVHLVQPGSAAALALTLCSGCGWSPLILLTATVSLQFLSLPVFVLDKSERNS